MTETETPENVALSDFESRTCSVYCSNRCPGRHAQEKKIRKRNRGSVFLKELSKESSADGWEVLAREGEI